MKNRVMVEFCRFFYLNLRTSFHKVLAASLLLGIFYAMNVPLAAQFVLTGKVIDESTREPLAFAVIADASSQRAAFSDIDGNFSLNANSSVLEIHVRLLGYEASRIKVNTERPVVITLRPITQSLPEIIILPGVNPADLLIQKAIDMKPANDPMRRSFACDAYFKLLVG
ncbi:MAG: carboxypeptidase-like regulatory domain-containing protein, partial [Flavobacteriales bacterium]